jgi:hypothetical protein
MPLAITTALWHGRRKLSAVSRQPSAIGNETAPSAEPLVSS